MIHLPKQEWPLRVRSGLLFSYLRGTRAEDTTHSWRNVREPQKSGPVCMRSHDSLDVNKEKTSALFSWKLCNLTVHGFIPHVTPNT